jgi:hypothetical protein
MKPQIYVRTRLENALRALGIDPIDPILLNLDKPKQDGFGDLAITSAMSLARDLRQPPRKIAEKLLQLLDLDHFTSKKLKLPVPDSSISIWPSRVCSERSSRYSMKEIPLAAMIGGKAFGFNLSLSAPIPLDLSILSAPVRQPSAMFWLPCTRRLALW